MNNNEDKERESYMGGKVYTEMDIYKSEENKVQIESR